MSANNPQMVDDSMISLFIKEAELHSKKLLDVVEHAEFETSLSQQCGVLAHTVKTLRGTAKLVQQQSVCDICSLLDDLLQGLQHGHLKYSAELRALLLKTANWLVLFSHSGIAALRTISQECLRSADEICVALATVINATRDKPKQPPTPRTMVSNPISDQGMLELFQVETDAQAKILTTSLLALEKNKSDVQHLEKIMRAAHSIKGAARMIGLDCAVGIAHLMEDCFVAAQEKRISINSEAIDVFLKGVDTLIKISVTNGARLREWEQSNAEDLVSLQNMLSGILSGQTIGNLTADHNTPANSLEVSEQNFEKGPHVNPDDRVLRVSASRLNTLMALSSELLVTSGWTKIHTTELLSIKRKQTELVSHLENIREKLDHATENEQIINMFSEAQTKADLCRQLLAQRLGDLDEHDRRTLSLTGRLNQEVLASRMRPFADGIQGFSRMVRDLARKLNKEINLQIDGLNTQVDRDILELIEAPLNQLLRNAVDHGIESPDIRAASGKPRRGTIKIEAMHNAGMLSIIVSDDGCGVDLESLRMSIIKKSLVNADMAAKLSPSELLDFLFLPGFSTRTEVTELSGRGVGLDIVHTTVQEMRGTIRSSTKLGHGLRIQLQLPLTLSVIRSCVVIINNEAFAFPLARINSIQSVSRTAISVTEDRQYIQYGDQPVGLVDSSQVFGSPAGTRNNEDIAIVILADRQNTYGLVVDSFYGERSLAVHTLDSRLGKIRNVSAAAILENGTPVLIVDTDDIIRSIENLISGKHLQKIEEADCTKTKNQKRILVVDDSLTVREVERKLLESHAYLVDVAVDGIDGWNTIRACHYDLVVTDVDMPRMNGIDFVTHIKQDSRLKNTPVMIVSYKDRPEDRDRGLNAGADYYLAKGSFHDDSLINAVIDLIGEAE